MLSNILDPSTLTHISVSFGLVVAKQNVSQKGNHKYAERNGNPNSNCNRVTGA